MKLIVKCLLLLSILFILSCENASNGHKISLSQLEPVVLDKSGNDLFQYWEVEDHDYYQNYELGNVEALKAYQDSIEGAIGDSLLQVMLKKERAQLNLASRNDDSLDNYDLIHQGYIGKIRQINFLEAEILNYQITRFPMFSHPTEFHVFVTENDSLELIRIYFGANDQPWPPKPKPIINHLENAQEKGWNLRGHLHNHYEPAEDNYLGVMAPSLADAHYFKVLRERFNLSEALITNGFSTVVLQRENFDKLNSH